MEQAFGFGWEYLEKAAREQASHSCAKWGIVQSLEKMHFTQHQINGVERKANLASSCIFLWACFKTEFLEVMVYTSIKTTLPGREIIQKKKKKKGNHELQQQWPTTVIIISQKTVKIFLGMVTPKLYRRVLQRFPPPNLFSVDTFKDKTVPSSLKMLLKSLEKSKLWSLKDTQPF